MPMPSSTFNTQTRRAFLMALLAAPVACGRPDRDAAARADLYPNETPELRRQIEHYAATYEVPVSLVQRVVIRESRHIPAARNGPYFGLMQILPQTAETMGYRGSPHGLLNADTNLKYGVKYLRGAWLVSGGDEDAAIGWYARGYYYEAKRLGLLEETGLRS
jgi:soluble lytic murein transglycosylase-like protein